MKPLLRVLLATFILALATWGPASAQPADYRTAERVYYSLTSKERFEIPMLLIATGHFNAMSTGEFSPRLFKAIMAFQGTVSGPQSGYLSGEQFSKLRVAGYGPMASWGFTEIFHPATSAKLQVPKGVAPIQTSTRRGYAFEAYDGSISIDYSFFPDHESSLEQLFVRMGSASGGRRIDYKVLRPNFFAIAGGVGARGFYTKYQLARGGIVGFTTSWDSNRVHRGERIPVLMANMLYVPLGAAEEPKQAALPPVAFAPAPAPPAPAAPPPVVSPPPPAVQAPKPESRGGGTGTGFYVSAKRLVTNAHVVDGCESVTVTAGQDKGAGRVVARDKANDLALVETGVAGRSIAKLRAGVRLGEDVAAFGYPLNGLLATSGNFTRGNVTATAGLRDDTSQLQISAPVQPGNSGGPLLDESGNVVGVVVSKLKALQLALLTGGDVAQNVNFAIKSSVAQTFMETNGTEFETGAPGETLKPADLAARAQSISVIIGCQP